MGEREIVRNIVEVVRYQCSACGMEFDSREDTQGHIDGRDCGDG